MESVSTPPWCAICGRDLIHGEPRAECAICESLFARDERDGYEFL